MPGCCDSSFELAVNQQFNQKKVAQEVKRYRENGPGPTTKRLADGIAQSGALSGSVLDIGSGHGGLTFALLDRGASSAIMVDASATYLEAAREESARRGRTGATQFVHADFVTAAPQLPSAAIVTLDRVVCCYASYQPLLAAALARAERCIALSYPRDVWYVRAVWRLENAGRWLTRSTFRAFVHPASRIEATIVDAGFRLATRQETWGWAADVYVRSRDLELTENAEFQTKQRS